MKPVKNIKTEPYAKPEVQDIIPVSVVHGDDGDSVEEATDPEETGDLG